MKTKAIQAIQAIQAAQDGQSNGSKLGTTSYKQSRLLPIDQANPFGDAGLILKNYDGTHELWSFTPYQWGITTERG